MGPFFFVLYMMIVYQSALIPRKLPCPKTLLVTRLLQYANVENLRVTFILNELLRLVEQLL